jgi:hypothetical protein
MGNLTAMHYLHNNLIMKLGLISPLLMNHYIQEQDVHDKNTINQMSG